MVPAYRKDTTMFHIGLGTNQQLVEHYNHQALQIAETERANKHALKFKPSWLQRVFGRSNECEISPAPPALPQATTPAPRPVQVSQTNGTV